MNSLHPDILEIIKALAAGNGKVLVRVAQAARMLDCDVKTFTKRYVDTNLIERIFPLNCKHAHYNVFDIIRVPELMKERDEFMKQQQIEIEDIGKPKSIDQIWDELEKEFEQNKKVA